MYLLLNLKDENSLSHVVNLLFANGYSAITLGQAIESLCPTCCDHSGQDRPVVVPKSREIFLSSQQDPSSSSPSPREASTLQLHAHHHQTLQAQIGHQAQHMQQVQRRGYYRKAPIMSISTTNSTNGAGVAGGPSSQSSVTSSQASEMGKDLVQGQDIPTQDREEVVFDAGGYPAAELIELKTEASMDDRSDSPIDVVVEDDSFNVHQALEMLGHGHGSGQVVGQSHYEPRKKRTRRMPRAQADSSTSSLSALAHQAAMVDGAQSIPEEQFTFAPEAFQCQMCKKSISRTGQYANLINHLSRHAKLHAQKKQYACPICNSSFSRRYLCVAHLKDAHPGTPEAIPIDYNDELKDEYRALLEVCFPMMTEYRKLRQTSTGQAGTVDGEGEFSADISGEIVDVGVDHREDELGQDHSEPDRDGEQADEGVDI